MEFALVLPIMLMVYAGVLEVNNYNNTYLKVSETAFEMEDLIGRQSGLCDTTASSCSTSGYVKMSLLCGLATQILNSSGNANLLNFSITIFDVTFDSSGNVVTTSPSWEVTSTPTSTGPTCAKATTVGTVTFPSQITTLSSDPGANTVSHLMVIVSYKYQSIFTKTILSFLNLPAIGSGPTLTYSFPGVPRGANVSKAPDDVIPYTTN